MIKETYYRKCSFLHVFVLSFGYLLLTETIQEQKNKTNKKKTAIIWQLVNILLVSEPFQKHLQYKFHY